MFKLQTTLAVQQQKNNLLAKDKAKELVQEFHSSCDAKKVDKPGLRKMG